MNTSPRVRLGIYLFVLFCASPSMAEPVLNGLAENFELNRERFIAGLYTSTPSKDPNDLLRNAGERRMELKITAKRLSAKNLNSMWIEGMAINNPGSALRTESESLSKLINMVRKSLYQGDTLRIDTAPGAGTTVTLNGIQLGNIPSEDFFSMVLRTWIGNVPLSTEFKANLLSGGAPEQGLRDRFSTMEPTPERVVAVEGWVVPAPPVQAPTTIAAVASITPPRPQIEISAPRPTIQAPTQIIQPPANETIEALRQQNPADVAASLPSTRPGQATEAAAAAAESEDQDSSVDSEVDAPIQIAQATPPSASISEQPAEQLEDEEEEEQAVVSAESIFDRTQYISDVLRQTQRSVKYPDRALRREQEGVVRVTVTVDNQGKLLGAIASEESRYGTLNREAIASFGRAEPFEGFPETINEEYISFTIPISFSIDRKSR